MFQWYVINTYSGHENKVKANLEHRIDSMGQSVRFRRVVVPTEHVIETKDGQKVQTEKRVLPGYVLVNMNMSDEAWTVVKGTPGVTGFVGAGTKPVPLSQPEVDRILHHGVPAGAQGQRPSCQWALVLLFYVQLGKDRDFALHSICGRSRLVSRGSGGPSEGAEEGRLLAGVASSGGHGFCAAFSETGNDSVDLHMGALKDRIAFPAVSYYLFGPSTE